MKTFCSAVVASAAAFLAAAAGADVPGNVGPETHLLEAKAPDGAVVAFVPSGSADGRRLVSAPEDAAAWRKWAKESHPGKEVELRWDVEPFDLEVVDADLLAWVREGDEGIDPAGRFRYAVASNPVPASGRVSLLLENAPDAKDFAPDCCASNVWLLSRDTLFARWKESARQGGAADVRRAFRSLKRSGRFVASPEWRAAADDFVAKMPDLRAAVRFRNGKKTPVRVRIGGMPETVPAGGSWDWSPREDTLPGPVSWEARDVGDGRSSDDDWTWSPAAEIAGFDPMGEDVDVLLSGPYGSLKPLPFLEFPAGCLPDGAVRAELQYADGGLETVPVMARNGLPAVECEPGRPVRQCVVRLDGWKDGAFAPEGGIASVARDRSLKLSGAPMERNLPPWKDGVVRIVWKNGFEGNIRLRVKAGATAIVDQTVEPGTESVPIPISESLRDTRVSETNIMVSWRSGDKKLGDQPLVVSRGTAPDEVSIVLSAPASKVAWPTADFAALKEWFSSVLFYLLPKDRENDPILKKERRESKKSLCRLLGFRPGQSGNPEREKTFDKMVSHIEGCSGCFAHRSSLSACAEALRSLGAESVESLTAWPKEGNFRGFICDWWKECTHVLDNVFAVRIDPTESLNKALERWNGEGDPRKPKTMFAEAYVHIVCCNGCDHCRPFRNAMLKEKTFENRRAALFRALMLWDGWKWKSGERSPTSGEVDSILQRFSPSKEVAQ